MPEHHDDGTKDGYLRRLSYGVCIFATDADLAATSLHDRPAFERISELERKLNFTMRPGASLVQIVQAHRRNRADEARQQSFCFR